MKRFITVGFLTLLMIVPAAMIAQTPKLQKIDSVKMLIDSINNYYKSDNYKKKCAYEKYGTQMTTWKNSFDSISEANTQLKDTVEILKKKNKELSALNLKLEPGWKCVLREMAENVDQVWLNKSFGEINSTEFAAEFELYEKYKGEDKGVGEAYKKLKTFRDKYLLFLDGVNAVNSPYDRNKVKNLVALFKDLMSKETRPPRSIEVKAVYDQLQDYDVTLVYFQEYVIDEVDELLKLYIQDGSQSIAWEQIDMHLKTKDNGQVEKNLTIIPWLGQQYHNYVEALKKDPYGYNEAREIIKALEP